MRIFRFAVLACGACGSSAGSVQGTVGGQSLAAADSLFYTLAPPIAPTTLIGIDSVSNLCSYAQKNELPKNLVSLAFYFTPPITSPGTFTIAQTGSVTAIWVTRDATCAGTSVDATGGTVTIANVSSTNMSGTFDVTFAQDHVTGSFDATGCTHDQDASPTCM